jgi:hypothetical protein
VLQPAARTMTNTAQRSSETFAHVCLLLQRFRNKSHETHRNTSKSDERRISSTHSSFTLGDVLLETDADVFDAVPAQCRSDITAAIKLAGSSKQLAMEV